jgi:hypothetical protein
MKIITVLTDRQCKLTNLLFFALLSICTPAFAQSLSSAQLASLEMKYWQMRGRLNGDKNNLDKYNGFVSAGTQSGQSMVFHNRQPFESPWHADYNKAAIPREPCTAQLNGSVFVTQDPLTSAVSYMYKDPRDNKDARGRMKASENPLINHGWYMAVLATEFALLQREGQDVSAVAEEMQLALSAIERLDKNCETDLYTQPLLASNLDGFLMRDDVPDDFCINHMGKNFDLVHSNFSCPKAEDKDVDKEAWKSAKQRCGSWIFGAPERLRINVASGDEYCGLFFGMMFIKKLVPANYVTPSGTNIVNLNAAICNRIIAKLVANDYIIRDPDGNAVCLGSFAVSTSRPMLKCARFITGNNNGPAFNTQSSTLLGEPIHYAYTQWWKANPTQAVQVPSVTFTQNFTAPQQWGLIPGTSILTVPSIDNIDNWLRVTVPCGYIPGNLPYVNASLATRKSTLLNLALLGNNNMEIYDLVGSLFMGYAPQLPVSFWANKFTSLSCAGPCWQFMEPSLPYPRIQNGVAYPPVVDPIQWEGCPYYEGNGITSMANEWASQNRFRAVPHQKAPELVQYFTGSVPIGNPSDYSNFVRYDYGEYPALDYLLAYNLFRLQYFNGGSSNRKRRNIDKTFPCTVPANNNGPLLQVGNQVMPFVAKAVFQITSNSFLRSNAVVSYSAGSDIKLLPGFIIKPGAIFTAKIKNYDCIATDYSGVVTLNKKEDTLDQAYYYDNTDTVLRQWSEGDSSIYGMPDSVLNDSIDSVFADAFQFDTYGDSIAISLKPDYTIDSTTHQLVYIGGNFKTNFSKDSLAVACITVYPNPTLDNIMISYYLLSQCDVVFSIYDIAGKLQKQWQCGSGDNSKGSHTKEFTLQTCGSGIYILHAQIGSCTKQFKVHKL